MASKPYYKTIAEHLLEQIRLGAYPPGGRLPSEKELMEQFGVSRIVAVQSLNLLARENVAFRHPGRGSFVAADALRSGFFQAYAARAQSRRAGGSGGRLPAAAFVAHRFDACTSALADSAARLLYQEGFVAALYVSNDDPQHEEQCLRQAADSAAGLLLLPTGSQTAASLSRLSVRRPLVLLDQGLPEADAPLVCSDHIEGARLATRHLLELGHTKIAVCSMSPLSMQTVGERIDGFLQEMSRQGRLVDPSLVLTGLEQENRREALDALIAARQASACLCLNNADFEAVTRAARQYGVRIPEELSVVTFDPLSLHQSGGREPAHVEQDVEALARKAVSLLLEQIRADKPLHGVFRYAPVFCPGWSASPLG